MTEAKSTSRGRRLTPEEAARYRAVREQIEREKPEIFERLRSEASGPKSWEEIVELRALVNSLRAAREERGLSREEAARIASLETRQIEELEEHRELNPQVSTLSRYAIAVGQHLMLALHDAAE